MNGYESGPEEYLSDDDPSLAEPPKTYDAASPAVTLVGEVTRIVYENTETVLWGVCRQRRSTASYLHRQPDGVVSGETVRLRWSGKKMRFGRQFRVSSMESHNLAPDGIERYLCSGLIPGIGPVYAKRLVEASAGNAKVISIS